ncbi:MAG: LamG-like jellyroll fold domain-containing protein [Kofleriaceae bacterium]
MIWLATFVACGRIGMDPRSEEVGPDASVDIDDPSELDPYLASVMEDNPIAIWRFENDGAIAYPTIGVIEGNIQGTATYGIGRHGAGLVFDGRTTRIDLAGLGSLGAVEMWVRPAVDDDQVRFLFDTTPLGERLSLYGADTFTIAQREATAMATDYAKAPSLQRDVFAHLVVTFDGTRTALYVDGVRHVGMRGAGVTDASDVTVIGDTVAGSFYKFEGVIDELAAYATTLSAERVNVHFAAAR